MRKNNRKIPLIAGIAAAELYRFYKGKGVFNGLRYKKQHRAIADYLDGHYPNAVYSPVAETEDGWSCIVTVPGGKIVLYLTCASDGTYIFWEKKI